ncbi:MAG: hypothetical protein EZS28_027035 [Streblomastix strix]|uniref:SPRY domain-containing protein n=1 Tax=Streblomastix strix TaxID=222440 RepID=A0A5J4V3W7_9EUKA|nr:MAG: hypothetical protein EZS28_027035 [Streblomastix strix]
MVVFDQEICSGIWKFSALATKWSQQFGIGIIDSNIVEIPHPYQYNVQLDNDSICYVGRSLFIKGTPIVDFNNKEITSGDQVSAIVDLTFQPPAFCLMINNKTQPFSVISVPDRNSKDEWKFQSLEELTGFDQSGIETKKQFKYV